MRLIVAVASVSLFAIAATFACSSADPVTEVADAGKKDSGKAVDAPPMEAPPTELPPVEPTEAGAGDDDDDAGTGTPGTVSMAGDAGAACSTTSFREAEPNNDTATANALTTPGKEFSFCGQVTKDDTDSWTFTTPDFDTSFNIEPTGNVRIQGTVGAQSFDSENGLSFGNIAVGDKWNVKITTTNPTARAYRINFKFN